MVPVQVKRCSILSEFTAEQQHQMFGLSLNKSLHHIDTLYYSVNLNEPKDIVKLQRDNNLPDNLLRLLQTLRECKDIVRDFSGGNAPMFGDLEMTNMSFSMYEYCVSLPECFDIFISSFLPNEETPRVVVQLRSRYLVLEGPKAAIEKSFRALREFLSPFGLLPVRVRENRIDYAFHTNLIQNPDKFFDDDKLRLHLKTNLRKYSKYGDTKEFSLDTLNLGRRKSNSVFFRAYNKGREVIEMNYKAFFIERWYREGLISSFDKYVYETAYRMKAYRSGILIGRLKWYLEYGTNDELKELCVNLIASDYIRSDNFDAIEKQIHNVIPEPTLIFNIEFQCKRKFFHTCAEWIGFKTVLVEHFEVKEGQAVDGNLCLPQFCDPLLHDLFGLIFSSREIIDYLTGFGNVVAFVQDRHMPFADFKALGEPYLYWWRRIRSTPIDYGFSTLVDLYRKYDSDVTMDRTRRLFEGQVARLSIMKQRSIEPRPFIEDIADALCVLNDNNKVTPCITYKNEDGDEILSFTPKDYDEIRKRKARQLRGVIGNEENNENAVSAQESEEKGS